MSGIDIHYGVSAVWRNTHTLTDRQTDGQTDRKRRHYCGDLDVTNLTVVQQDTLLNVFLAIAVDNLANAQELTAAEEAAAAEQALKVSL